MSESLRQATDRLSKSMDKVSESMDQVFLDMNSTFVEIDKVFGDITKQFPNGAKINITTIITGEKVRDDKPRQTLWQRITSWVTPRDYE